MYLQREAWKIGKVFILCLCFILFHLNISSAFSNTSIYNIRWADHKDFFRLVFCVMGKRSQDIDSGDGHIFIVWNDNVETNSLVKKKVNKIKKNFIEDISFKKGIIISYNREKMVPKTFFLIDGKNKYRLVIDFYNKKNKFHSVSNWVLDRSHDNEKTLNIKPISQKQGNVKNNYPIFNSFFKKMRFSGKIENRAANQLNYNKFEDKRYINTKIRAKIKYDLSGSAHGWVPPSKRSYGIMSWDWDFLYIEDTKDERDVDFGLHEGYLVINKGPFRIRVGKQVIRWGKTDQISPVDNLNSQDLRLFILPPYEERKIPNWMGDIEFFKNNFRLEGVVIPFVEPNDVYFFDRNFAVFKQLKNSSSYFIDKYKLPAYLKNYINNLQVDKRIPAKSLENVQGGGRIGFSTDSFDMSISYLNGFDPNPYIKSFPVKGIKVKEDFSGSNLIEQLPFIQMTNGNIEASYIRRNIYGIEFEGTFDEFGVRGEAAFFDKNGFLTQSLVSVHKQMLWYVLGMDYNGDNDLYLNVELSHNHIFHYEDDLLYFKEDNISLLAEVSKGFMEGDWKIGVKYSYFLSDYSYYINPYFVCKKVSNLDLEIGVIGFGGDKDTLMGQYDLADEVYFVVKLYF